MTTHIFDALSHYKQTTKNRWVLALMVAAALAMIVLIITAA
jgi:hypothetical protein